MKKFLKTIYSAVIIAVFGTGYVLANYFPQYLKPLGLEWLNSHKQAEKKHPALDCKMNWDWGTGTAVVANFVDYQLTCRAKRPITLSDSYIYISNVRGRESGTRPDSDQPFKGSKSFKSGESFSAKGTLNRLNFLGKDKKAKTYLIFSTHIDYSGSPPKGDKSHDPFNFYLSTGVY